MDILTAGLDPLTQKMVEARVKTEGLSNEYGKIPGALNLILRNYDALILKAYELQDIGAQAD